MRNRSIGDFQIRFVALTASLCLLFALAFMAFTSDSRILSVSQSTYVSLANEYFNDKSIPFSKEVLCNISPDHAWPWSERGIACEIESTCGTKIVNYARFRLIRGVEFGPDPFFQKFYAQCPEMLKSSTIDMISSMHLEEE